MELSGRSNYDSPNAHERVLGWVWFRFKKLPEQAGIVSPIRRVAHAMIPLDLPEI